MKFIYNLVFILFSMSVFATEPIDYEAGSKHWAFQDFKATTSPKLSSKNRKRVRNPIDTFVLAQQEKNNLTMAEDAKPDILLRRVYLDLIGLPPTAAEQAAFMKDPSDNNYANGVYSGVVRAY